MAKEWESLQADRVNSLKKKLRIESDFMPSVTITQNALTNLDLKEEMKNLQKPSNKLTRLTLT